MLSLEDISLDFGGDQLLDKVSVQINRGERVGLTGPNGAGKSTLLKLIAGELHASAGRINYANDHTIGYLPQDGINSNPSLTVLEEVESSFTELLALQEKTQQARQQIAQTEQDTASHQKALDKYGELQTRLEQSGAYSLHADIEKVLDGLGFSESDFHRKISVFSGGWLMRIALAKLLLKRPDYLLLDEPTNHLDIESLRWIEQFLEGYEGAIIVVSHDKNFLDLITQRTLYLSRGHIMDYGGNYSWFQKKHAERMEHRRKAYENQQREIKQIQDFIDKFRYNASKAKQVQSRIKKLEKMEMIEEPVDLNQEISFQLPDPQRSGEINMRLENVSKSFGDIQVFTDLSYLIGRGDKIAVVGPNGAGKSTLARMMAGLETIDSGRCEPGHKVEISYFAQHQADELDLNQTIFGTMREAAPRKKETEIRTLLGCFLFHGDDVFKKVSVLSGGEKSRVALARMLISPANFLIFDEPTNHLDMQSKEVLQHALEQYKGTCLIISHDIDFLDPIVDKVLEVQSDELNNYPGNVSWYLQKKENQKNNNQQKETAEQQKHHSISRKEERRREAVMRQKRSKKIKPLKNELNKLENKISEMEQRHTELENQMAQPDFYDNGNEVNQKSKEYDQLKQNLDRAYQKWETLGERLEQAKALFNQTHDWSNC